MSAATWKIDAAHSQVEFAVKHMMFTTVRGRFGALEGTIVLDADRPEVSSVEVAIETASLDTRVPDRDVHLRSPDFFHAERHPTLTFRSRRLEGFQGTQGEEFRIVGDLTMRGTTREVVLTARLEGMGTDPWGGSRAGFSARTTIDRRDFGLTWNQTLEAGGVLVAHEVIIEIHVQAVEVQEAPSEEALATAAV